MDLLNYRSFCLNLPLVEECTPFDDTILVFKVAGKMFSYASMERFDFINLKCDPDRAIALREEYPEDVTPGYHANKRHWNSVNPAGDLPDTLIKEWIVDSYRLVIYGLPKAKREELLPLLKEL